MAATPAQRKTSALANAVTDSQMANHIFSSSRIANLPHREVAAPHRENVATAITPEDCAVGVDGGAKSTEQPVG